MIVLSHRGYWKEPAEKNTETAFRRSFALGFGTETDLRDCAGTLVISHDPPVGGEMTAEAFFALYAECGRGLPLALNIKADGLQAALAELLQRHAIEAAFVFDMAVPDALGYLTRAVPAFTRHSELEPACSFYDRAAGVWIDCFFGDWYGPAEIALHLEAGKRVCLVSPDLHRRPYRTLWDRLAASPVAAHPRLMICTDYPEEARSVFHPAGADSHGRD